MTSTDPESLGRARVRTSGHDVVGAGLTWINAALVGPAEDESGSPAAFAV
jgi:hypothetical protein